MSPKPNIKQAVPFFAVSDIEASVRFYVDGLGFEMTRNWRVDGRLRWCWLQRGGGAVMLQEFSREGHDSWQPSGKLGEGVTIYFICEDALAIYHEATDQGIQASRPFVGNAMWVTSLSDPDGYRIDFESDTDVPEGTEYSGHSDTTCELSPAGPVHVVELFPGLSAELTGLLRSLPSADWNRATIARAGRSRTSPRTCWAGTSAGCGPAMRGSPARSRVSRQAPTPNWSTPSTGRTRSGSTRPGASAPACSWPSWR